MATSSSSSSSSSYMYSSSSSSIDSSSSSSSLKHSSSSSSSSSSTSSETSGSSSSSSSSNSSLSSYSTFSSSSTSSESSGNTSSSSSSFSIDFDEWNQIKPLYLANSAISNSPVNRLLQTITLQNDTYDIKEVFVYLYGPYGDLSSVTLHMNIYDCNDDYTPLNVLASSTISGSTITENKWYSFTFSLEGITPSNNLLAFEFYQSGGDEDNYVLWGYLNQEQNGTKALWSNDGGTIWNEQTNTLRALNVVSEAVGEFNLFDLVNYRMILNGADRIQTIHQTYEDFADGDFDNTQAVNIPSSYGYTEQGAKVILDLPDLLVSFVIDASGSMGWADRFDDRKEFLRVFIDRFLQYYPSSVLFDFIRSGSQIIDTLTTANDIEFPATVNLDLNNPIRRQYLFTISNTSSATLSDVYKADNDIEFTVLKSASVPNTHLVCQSDLDPFSSGTLTKVSGSGDNTITYTSFKKADPETQSMVAFGFKNLEKEHTYNIGNFRVDRELFASSETQMGWQDLSLGPISITFDSKNNGPSDSNSVDFYAANDVTIVRRPLTTLCDIQQADITSDVSEDDTTINVSSHEFNPDDYVDILDSTIASFDHVVTNTSSTTITVTPAVPYNINSLNGVVQSSTYSDKRGLARSTTFNILFRDITNTQDITFYAQLSSGLAMEWDCSIFDQWYTYPLFYYGDTTTFTMSAFDEDNDPVKDGTEIQFYVDELPSDISAERDELKQHTLIENSNAGSTSIALDSTNGYSLITKVDIYDANNLQTVQITNIESTTNTLTVTPSMEYDFTVSNSSSTVLSAANRTVITDDNDSISAAIGTVDMTPAFVGRNLDSSLLEDFDPTPISPSYTYDDVNLDRARTINNVNQIPSINGKALLRVLPITEDSTKTKSQKEIESNRDIYSENGIRYIDQVEWTEGDEETYKDEIDESSSSESTDVNTSYSVNNSTFEDGYAEGKFAVVDEEFTEIDGSVLPYINNIDNFNKNLDPDSYVPLGNQNVLGKPYELYPIMNFKDSDNITSTQYLFDPVNFYFVSSIFMYSNVSNTVPYNDCFSGFDSTTHRAQYRNVTANGSYVNGDSFTINYLITDRNSLANNADLKIRIYYSPVFDLRDVASWGQGYQDSNEKYSVSGPPENRMEFNNLTRRDIDQFRTIADSNTSPTLQKGQERYATEFEYIGQEWEKATDLVGTVADTTINIVQGRASITIPSVNKEGLLYIQASVSTFGGDEIVKTDTVFISNPISIERITPQQIITDEDQTTGEISVAVTYMGNAVANDTVVKFENSARFDDAMPKVSADSSIKPSISKIEDGIAYGVILGPHETVIQGCDSNGNCYGEYESLSMTATSNGFSETVEGVVEWYGIDVDSDSASVLNDFFKVDDGTVGYSDGDNGSVFTLDLSDPDNVTYAADAIPYLEGQDQVDGLPAPINVEIPSGLTVEFLDGGGRWTESGTASFKVNLNSDINTLADYEIKVTSTYRKFNSTTQKWDYETIAGYKLTSGLTGYSLSEPSARFVESLGISVDIESQNSTLLRDGSDSPLVIADVTWNGSFIKDEITFDEGTELERNIEVEFPYVDFQIKGLKEGDTVPEEDGSLTLKSYNSQASISRTTAYSDVYGSHVHSVSVDESGDGTTTSVIISSGAVSSHTHTVSNYQVASSSGHTHTLRSVAISQINPTVNKLSDVYVYGTTLFDPTNASGGRTESDTLILGKPVSSDELILEITSSPKIIDNDPPRIDISSSTGGEDTTRYFLSRTSGNADRGFDVLANAYLLAASGEKTQITDGSRIIFDIKAYSLETGEGVRLIESDALKDNMLLDINVSVTYEDQTVSGSIYVVMSSSVQWVPRAMSLLENFTNDTIDINTVYSKIISTGGSPIHDGVKLAAERLTDKDRSNSTYGNSAKIIFLISDGDENNSENSIDSAINSVNFINGKEEVPVVPIKLGLSYGSDDVLFHKYTDKTGGKTKDMVYLTSESKVTDIVNEIIVDEDISVLNQGTYKNTFSLDKLSLLDNIDLSTVIPSGSEIQCRARHSSDGVSWSSFTSYFDYPNLVEYAETLDSVAKYLQYDIRLVGTNRFITPEVRVVTLNYYNPKSVKAFFYPVDLDISNDEYVSMVHFAHESENWPAASQIKYGFSHIDTTDFNNYYSTTQPLIEPFKKAVILSRHNEKLISTDNAVYSAPNGGWPDGATIEIYRVNSVYPNGKEIDSSQYIADNKTGNVTFFEKQNSSDEILLTVIYEQLMRTVCYFTNYSPDIMTVDSIGIMYNVTDRIKRDLNGNIIRE